MAKSSQFSDSFSIPKSAQCQIVKKIGKSAKETHFVLPLLKVLLKLIILGQILFLFVTVQCKRLSYLTSFFLRTKIIISPFLSPLVPE